jgi:CBS domain-containing protein
MRIESDTTDDLAREDEAYFDLGRDPKRSFDARLLEEPLTALPTRPPLVMAESASVKDAMQAMQRRHRGCVLITADGSTGSKLTGIFTERDVLLKVIDCGRNPATLLLGEVMTADPESLMLDGKLAWALNMMSVGGYRNLPVTDAEGRPVLILSMRDIVQVLVESFPAEILNLPPDFGRVAVAEREGA